MRYSESMTANRPYKIRKRKNRERTYRSGKAAKYEPAEFRIWYLRLLYNMRQARLERDVSMKELSAACGINDATIAKIEMGHQRDMKMTTLFRFARSMGLDVHELIP